MKIINKINRIKIKNLITNTYPPIIHLNGHLTRGFNKKLYNFLLNNFQSIDLKIPNNCCIFSMCTDNLIKKCVLSKYLEMNKNIILKEISKSYYLKNYKNVSKIIELNYFLKNCDYDKIIMVDALDVFFLNDIQQVFHNLKNNKIFFGAEKFFPYKLDNKEEVKKYHDKFNTHCKENNPFRYLCAGVFGGYKDNLLEMTEKTLQYFYSEVKYMNNKSKKSEQNNYIRTLFKENITIDLDYNNKFVLNNNGVTENELLF